MQNNLELNSKEVLNYHRNEVKRIKHWVDHVIKVSDKSESAKKYCDISLVESQFESFKHDMESYNGALKEIRRNILKRGDSPYAYYIGYRYFLNRLKQL